MNFEPAFTTEYPPIIDDEETIMVPGTPDSPIYIPDNQMSGGIEGQMANGIIPETYVPIGQKRPASPRDPIESAAQAGSQDDDASAAPAHATARPGWKYDTAAVDGKILLTCDWSQQTPLSLWELLTSEGHGTEKRPGMTAFFRQVLKFLSTSPNVKPDNKSFILLVLTTDAKALNGRKAQANKPFQVQGTIVHVFVAFSYMHRVISRRLHPMLLLPFKIAAANTIPPTQFTGTRVRQRR